MAEAPDGEDLYIDLPVGATGYPRWGTVHGRHHIPTVGTLLHDKRWYSARVRVRFLPVDGTRSRSFTIDARTLEEIITAPTLAEARTLISLCLADAET
ncbi:hypothetical protein [Streptomyces sp. CC219B]|uniref:hypothetical protein n=1 Tax=Streptomyces sp. CC219B TaxID=3044574 RepID=UPI0024A9CE8C|nr:hypothetical protein [Streptomyces sp. CC219B]